MAEPRVSTRGYEASCLIHQLRGYHLERGGAFKVQVSLHRRADFLKQLDGCLGRDVE